MRPARFRGVCSSVRSTVQRASSTTSAPPSQGKIFNIRAKQLQRDRGALNPESASCDYLREEVAGRLADRLRDIHGYTYPTTVDYMCHAGQLTKKLLTQKAGIAHIYACDTSAHALKRDEALSPSPFSAAPLIDARSRTESAPLAVETPAAPDTNTAQVTRVLISPDTFPFPRQSLDLVISNLALHWTDDLSHLVGAIHTALKPNGLFLGALFGGNTLRELKEAFMVAEQERDGGVSPHTSPMAGVSDVGNVLTANGFTLTTG